MDNIALSEMLSQPDKNPLQVIQGLKQLSGAGQRASTGGLSTSGALLSKIIAQHKASTGGLSLSQQTGSLGASLGSTSPGKPKPTDPVMTTGGPSSYTGPAYTPITSDTYVDPMTGSTYKTTASGNQITTSYDNAANYDQFLVNQTFTNPSAGMSNDQKAALFATNEGKIQQLSDFLQTQKLPGVDQGQRKSFSDTVATLSLFDPSYLKTLFPQNSSSGFDADSALSLGIPMALISAAFSSVVPGLGTVISKLLGGTTVIHANDWNALAGPLNSLMKIDPSGGSITSYFTAPETLYNLNGVPLDMTPDPGGA